MTLQEKIGILLVSIELKKPYIPDNGLPPLNVMESIWTDEEMGELETHLKTLLSNL